MSLSQIILSCRNDPLKLAGLCWPGVRYYDKECDMIMSVRDNIETFVYAGNMLGKDYVAGYIALTFFLFPQVYFPADYVSYVESLRSPSNPNPHKVRVINTSIKDDHLRVLWAEIGNYISTCKFPLDVRKGGPLIINHRDIKKYMNGQLCDISYLKGMVCEKPEAIAGHHAAYTLFMGDEASGIEEAVYTQGCTWSKKRFIFGNCNDCDNFFRHADRDWREGRRIQGRSCIYISAKDSPNVRLGEAEVAQGKPASNRMVVPGVLPYNEYLYRRQTWDIVRQTVGLDAQFYEGAQLLLFPSEWLNYAHELHRAYTRQGRKRIARSIGVDPAEGGDSTTLAVCDELGLIELVSLKTPDTNKIPGLILGYMKQYNVPPEYVLIDAGGGGKQHADRLRAQGYKVRTVAFGETMLPPIKRTRVLEPFNRRLEVREDKYVYLNRRAEMYGELSLLLDPTGGDETRQGGYSIPEEYSELRRQLAVIRKEYDDEGRLLLPPKNRKPGQDETKRKTLRELLGRSPDEADALVLAVHGILHPPRKVQAGAIA